MTSTFQTGRRLGPLATLAATLLLGLAVGACGSSSSSGSSGTSGAGAAAGGATNASSARFQARVNLAKCLRAHGVNVPDPTPGGGPAGGGGAFRAFRALRDLPQAQQQALRQDCRQYFSQAFPFLNLTPAQRAQLQQQLVRFAECMRSHGINIPDPTTGGTSGFGGIRRAFGNVDRNSPAFRTALAACQGVRPRFGPGGGGPGGAPGAAGG